MTSLDPGHTIRFPATSLFLVDSADRFDTYIQSITAVNSDPYNFTLPNRGLIQTGQFTRIGVSEVVMPWCPNINPKTCTILMKYVKGGVLSSAITINIPQGFKKPSEIASDLQAEVRKVDASLSDFTVTYGNPTADEADLPLFTYKLNTSTATQIAFFPVDYTQRSGAPVSNNFKQLFNLLGFTEQNNILVNSGNGFPTYCQAVRYVDIVCNYFTQYQSVFDASTAINGRDSLCRVYLDSFTSPVPPSDPSFAPPGTTPCIVHRDFTNPKYIKWIGKQNIGSSSLSFSVYDDQGQIFSTDQPFGAYTTDNWSMTLLVSEN